MGVKYLKDGRIQDFNFTITITGKCNLDCKYCPLINKNNNISYKTLDDIILFFQENEELIKKKIKSIVFIFFGGEPLLYKEKIEYFINKMYNFGIETRYVIYTNGLLIDKNFLLFLKKKYDYKRRIIFYISIDGDSNIMLKARFKNNKQFNILIKNIKLLRQYGFDFSVSKVLHEKKSIDIYNSFIFLDGLQPNKLDFLPVSFNYDGGYTLKNIKEIIKGIDLFIDYLLSKGMLELNILEYLGLPDDLEGFKELYKVDYGVYLDFDGTLYGIIDGISIFDKNKTFISTIEKDIRIGNINNQELLIGIIFNYRKFEKNMFKIGKKWILDKLSNENKYFSLISMYFIKKLLIYKYKPQN